MQEEPTNNQDNSTNNTDSAPEGVINIPVNQETGVNEFNSTPDTSLDNSLSTSTLNSTSDKEASIEASDTTLSESDLEDPTPLEDNIESNSSSSDSTYTPQVLNPTTVVKGPDSSRKFKRLLIIICLILIIGLATGAGYIYGKRSVKTVSASNTSLMSMAASLLKVPQGATIMEQCVAGLGTQYILPKDIPDGPVYNVYQGKVIGIEYMINLASIEKLNTAVTNLPLFNKGYDHINIMSMAAHAGFPVPHYQVDVMMVPTSFTNKITCSGSTSTSSGSMTGSMTSSMGTKSPTTSTTTK